MQFDMVIGLEVHVQLKTRSKMFSSAPINYGAAANTQAAWVDLAMPGTLPVVNKKAIEMAIMFGIAINAEISRNSFFARKNYFYPDLPKGYQISQSSNPIVQNGEIEITTNRGTKIIHIERAHLEEDAGKSVHHLVTDGTGIDYNRAGTPLLEVVTHPDFRSSEEVISYLKAIHQLVCHLDICDGNMQEGSLRCDVNLSIKKQGSETLGTRVELKNINSFKFIESAINYEYQRQVSHIENNVPIVQESRLYDPENNETRSMRNKENAFDYRYFPDPDLLPVIVTSQEIDRITDEMPMLPGVRQRKYAENLGADAVNFLMEHVEIANYYDRVCRSIPPKVAYNWVSTELQALFNREQKPFNAEAIPAHILIEIIQQVDTEAISVKSAKKVLQHYYAHPADINAIIDQLGLRQSNDISAVETLVHEIISNNKKQVDQYLSGKTQLLGFFVGQVMKKSQGKANPKQVSEVISQKLSQINPLL